MPLRAFGSTRRANVVDSKLQMNIKNVNEVPCSPTSSHRVAPLVVLPGTGFDEEAALLGAGREFALMKTASGKVSVK